jgi:hypothetical protein
MTYTKNFNGSGVSNNGVLPYNSIYLEIPKIKSMYDDLYIVDKKTNINNMKQGIPGSCIDWLSSTTALKYASQLIGLLAQKILADPDATVNFCNLFYIRSSELINKESEKEMNINIVYTPGPLLDFDFTDEEAVEKFMNCEFRPPLNDKEAEMDEMYKDLKIVDITIRREMYTKNIWAVASDWTCTKIAFNYFRNLMAYAIQKLIDSEDASIENVEFYHIFVVNTMCDDGPIKLFINPGPASKLSIKDDDNFGENRHYSGSW